MPVDLLQDQGLYFHHLGLLLQCFPMSGCTFLLCSPKDGGDLAGGFGGNWMKFIRVAWRVLSRLPESGRSVSFRKDELFLESYSKVSLV